MRILFVAPHHRVTRAWFEEVASDASRGRGPPPTVRLIDTTITLTDGSMLQFVTLHDEEDFHRLRGHRFSAIVEHHYMRENGKVYELWSQIKPHIVDGRA